MGDAPFGLVPDLARGAELVRPRIRLIRVLIDVEPLLRLVLHQLAGEPDGSVGLLQGIAEDDPRAEVPSDPLARFAHVARHHQRDGDVKRGADPCVCDPGIAAGRVEQRPPAQSGDRFLHHAQRGAILHASAGVEPLQLGVDLHAGRLQGAQPDHGRVPDGLRE